MKRPITDFMLSMLAKCYDRIMAFKQRAALETLRRTPNVEIDQSFRMGESSAFNIRGPIGILSIDGGVYCERFCNFLMYPNSRLKIGRNVFLNNNCSINCLGYINIGDNTLFGEGVKIYDHNHNYTFDGYGTLTIDRDKFRIGSINIGANCWIGSNVTILKDVDIGDNVIIGANNLIYKSVPPNTIVKASTLYPTNPPLDL